MTRTPFIGALLAAAGRALPVLLVASLAGCSSAYTIEPVGLQPVPLDPDDWNGCWATVPDDAACAESAASDADRDQAAAFIITVADAAAGVLSVQPVPGRTSPQLTAWVRAVPLAEPADGEDVEPVPPAREALRRRPPGTFITLENEDEDGTPQLLFFWIHRSNDELLLWEPAADAFRVLVSRGVLPGTPLGEQDVLLGHLDRRSLAEITGESRWDLFRWEEPLVLWRVTRDGPR